MGLNETNLLPLSELSVLVSSYNKKEFLDQSSVFLHRLEELGAQVIIVEDSSTDGSIDVIQSWKAVATGRIQLVIQKNSGSAQSRNTAISLAERKYVLFVDIDDVIDVGCLVDVFPKFLQESPDIALTGYVQVPAERLGPYPLAGYDSTLTSIVGHRTELLQGMGWWRYVYKNEMLKQNNLHFTPSFKDMGGQIFVLDDLFWLLHLFSMDISLYRCDESAVLYRYFLPDISSPERRNWYLNQVILIPQAMKIFLRGIDSHTCHHDQRWLLESCHRTLWQHANYLDFPRYLTSLREFISVSIQIDLRLRNYFLTNTFRMFVLSSARSLQKFIKLKLNSDPVTGP